MAITVSRSRYLEPPGLVWPDATTTGVPVGTSLTTHSGDYETSANNELVEDLDIGPGTLVIQHNDVTVRRCRITVGGSAGLYVVSGKTGALAEDCEIVGTTATAVWPDGGELTVRRLYIHGTENGVTVTGDLGFLMEDCFMEDLETPDPAHADGIQSSPGASNVTIRGCNFDLHNGISGGIQLETQPLPIEQNSDWLVEDNRVILYADDPAPGAVTIRLPQEDVSANNIRFLNNRLMPGLFGSVIFEEVGGAITEWTGNVNDETGDPIELP